MFGRISSPADDTRNAGGSSGGEAALIGAGLSVVGIGSDIGGSNRVPASACGIVGFRPSSHRFPTGAPVRRGGAPGASLTSWGPLARSVEDIEVVM